MAITIIYVSFVIDRYLGKWDTHVIIGHIYKLTTAGLHERRIIYYIYHFILCFYLLLFLLLLLLQTQHTINAAQSFDSM